MKKRVICTNYAQIAHTFRIYNTYLCHVKDDFLHEIE